MDKNMPMIAGSTILGVAVAAVLGVLMLAVLLFITKALASMRRIERRVDGLTDDLSGAARNVELTLDLAKSAKGPHGGLESLDKSEVNGWQFTEATEAREGMLRWVGGGQRLLGVLARTLQDYDRLRAEADASMREVERLGGEVGRLREENGRFLQERAEIAQTLSRIVNDALLPRR